MAVSLFLHDPLVVVVRVVAGEGDRYVELSDEFSLNLSCGSTPRCSRCHLDAMKRSERPLIKADEVEGEGLLREASN